MSASFDLPSLLRPNIRNLKPYSSARSEFVGEADVFLDANENPFGSPTESGAYNRYPDPLQKELKSKIAAIKRVSPERIFLGNGSDEAIDLLVRVFCEPERDAILVTPPTYGMYEVSASIHNARITREPLVREGIRYKLNTPGILDRARGQNAKLIFICNPNNPTGNAFDDGDIERLLGGFGGVIVVDEAYGDYAPERSFLPRLENRPNLVVLQTFSKAWGMAGLRLGMAFASEEIVRVLNAVKPPYNINALTQEAALTAIARASWKEEVVRRTLAERERLESSLARISGVQRVYPSDANFLLVRVAEARTMYERLVREKIIVRDRSNVELCEGCLRVTVGTPEENDRLTSALERANA